MLATRTVAASSETPRIPMVPTLNVTAKKRVAWPLIPPGEKKT